MEGLSHLPRPSPREALQAPEEPGPAKGAREGTKGLAVPRNRNFHPPGPSGEVSSLINWISSRGWAIHLKPGRVYLEKKGHDDRDYPDIKSAYFAIGGKMWDLVANPKRLKP